ncbi:MAG: hypothetical protein GWN12_09835 [Thermoplasmata archaeon]|nr:hypothetical protein [Thermoplasmata archaeon]NIT78420.1 hypothetical protein [Thermoplasmata archaeon]NIW89060.1 hypothetical protein [Thermoplasmata archaeon]NIY04789.1 hypothetical protein [Thermoplasmata archaeon]
MVDILTTGTGLVLIVGSAIDPVPLDELVGIPLGLKLLGDGIGGKPVDEALGEIPAAIGGR